MSNEIVMELLNECAEAGIVFHPSRGRLRPELTRGRISADLKARVEASAEALRQFFAEAFDWPEDLSAEEDSTPVCNAQHTVLNTSICGDVDRAPVGGPGRADHPH